MGQTVNCLWPEDKQFYAAQIVHVHQDEDKYDVYFLDDSVSLDNVKSSDIKMPLNPTGGRYFSHWNDLDGKTFYDPGSRKSLDGEDFPMGEYRVLCVHPNPRKHCFQCQRVSFDDNEEGIEILEFDIAYVIKRVRVYEEE